MPRKLTPKKDPSKREAAAERIVEHVFKLYRDIYKVKEGVSNGQKANR